METNDSKGKRPPPSDTEGVGEDLQLLLQNFNSLSSDAQHSSKPFYKGCATPRQMPAARRASRTIVMPQPPPTSDSIHWEGLWGVQQCGAGCDGSVIH